MAPKTSRRRTTGKQGPRVLLLVSALCSVVPPCLAWSWTCRLDSVPVEDVPMTALQHFQKVDDGGRRLRSSISGGGDATALPRDHVERRDEELARGRRLRFGKGDETGIDQMHRRERERPGMKDGDDAGDRLPDDTAQTAAYAEGRRCACVDDWIDSEVAFYCPLPADRCLFSRARHGAPGVACYVHGGWEVRFARDVWIYLCFILLLLVLYPCFSSSGRHAVRYLLSKCFPRMNGWIAEHLLRAEIETRNLVSEEFQRFARRKRRTEGWISEYRVKTTLYSREGTAADDDGENATDSGDGAELGGEDCETANGNRTEENEDPICTICLTAVEDGDRVPALGCGHLFHSDCMSEWILKKNSCPLCSGPVAREIRSFETNSPTENTDSARSEDALSRLHHSVRDGILDVATGRDRRSHVANRNRIRTMLNDGLTDVSREPR